MLGRTDSRARLLVLVLAMAVIAVALGGRLAYWQLGEGPALRRIAESRLAPAAVAEEATVQRGDISDRRGALLATTAYRDLLAAYPDLMPADRRGEMALTLADLLGFGPLRTAQLVDSFERAVPYVVVARRLSEAQSRQVRDAVGTGELSSLALEPQVVRFYPNGGGAPNTSLASQLLGFVSDAGVGQYGVEGYNQALLAGQSGETASAGDDGLLPRHGGSLALTLDASLQLRLEKELYAAWIADRAARVSGLVMDARTGAILAWGSVPGYDANEYTGAAPELFDDPIAGQVYEPGSVMKLFTAAAAFDAGAVRMDTPILDSRTLEVDGGVVWDSDRKAMGEIPFEDAIAYSRNVAVGRVALMLGKTTDQAAAVLYDTWQRLGLGRASGVDLPAEAGGLVADPAHGRWQTIDLVNRAFGQGVAITPLQLAVGYAAMANGGRLVTPHVVAAEDDRPVAAGEPEQAISPALSARLRDLLTHVVTEGPRYARQAQLPGYFVGGKTGTAQIWNAAEGAWDEHLFNHTFSGFIGTDSPDYIIVVRIHEAEPTVMRPWGISLEISSGELFRRIAQNLVDVLDLPPAGG
jgi:cell division protein FtsI/penicillin-binding protein 2